MPCLIYIGKLGWIQLSKFQVQRDLFLSEKFVFRESETVESHWFGVVFSTLHYGTDWSACPITRRDFRALGEGEML